MLTMTFKHGGINVRDVRKKEEGRVSTWVPTRYGFESRIGRANLACKFRSKNNKTVKSDVFY